MAKREYGYQKEREGYSIWTIGLSGSRQDVVGYARTKRDAQRKVDKLYAQDEATEREACKGSTAGPSRHHATKKSAAQLQREIDAVIAKPTKSGSGSFFFIPQTGQISDKAPRSNYYAYQIPDDKRKFIEDWIEAAHVTSSGLEYPPGFIRTLDTLERQFVRRR